MSESKHEEREIQPRIDNNPDKIVNLSFINKKIKKNPWMVSSLILGVILIILIILYFSGYIGSGGLSGEKAGEKVVSYLNSMTGGGVSYVSNEDIGNLYEITVSYQENKIPVFVTKDGKYFVQGAVIMDEVVTNESTTQEIPQSDKPKIELFVMSFCPYGVQAEDAMKPVYDLLKDKADFNIRFIVSVGGDTLDSVSSLHGALEAEEDARQLCIAKEYPGKLWGYVAYINEKCYPSYREEGNLEKCWKNAADENSISVSKIEQCVSSNAVSLLSSEEALAGSYGVSGSPTLIINGVKYNGGRTSEAYKQAICSAFNEPPEMCGEELSSESATASGSC